MNGLLPRRDGYLVLFAALVAFALAALHLTALRQREEEAPGPPRRPGGEGASPNAPPVTVEFSPRPFLYYFLREAGFAVKIVAAPPEEPRALLLVVNPPPGLHPDRAREIVRFVERGGGLLLFCPTDHPLARLVGAEVAPDPLAGSGEWTVTSPAYPDVGPLAFSTGRIGRRRGASLVFTAEAPGEGYPTALSGRGEGLVHLLAAPDLFTADGLGRAGNALLVTRLVERLARRGRTPAAVHIWHPQPDLVVQARVRPPAPGQAPEPRKRKRPDPSLRSLLLANPASLIFVQLALALLLLLRTLARRPARAVPAPVPAVPPEPFHEALARLHLRRGAAALLARSLSRELDETLRRLAPAPAAAESGDDAPGSGTARRAAALAARLRAAPR